MLTKPEGENLRKLHTEITQIVHQRFLVTSLAITSFGGALAWMVPKERLTGIVPISTVLLSALLCFILFVLFLYSHSLLRMMRIFTTYLRVTDASPWEKDWRLFRQTWPGYFGYTKSLTLMFLFLQLCAAFFPLFVSCAYGLNLEPSVALSVLIVLAIVVFITTMLLGFEISDHSEKRAEEVWKNLAASP